MELCTRAQLAISKKRRIGIMASYDGARADLSSINHFVKKMLDLIELYDEFMF